MYVKKYNQKGELVNPITKVKPFLNSGENRKKRREGLQKVRFIGNVKHGSLSVIGGYKYRRCLQTIDLIEQKMVNGVLRFVKVGEKTIRHQLPC